MEDDPVNFKELRYVLYARKSTTDDGHQVRSIGDQIADCRQLAERQGLKIVEILKESKSAKKSGQRPIFAQMLKDIPDKYDAILCWHPDRLCRNMLDAGFIIDMLDDGRLRDLKFNSHQFSNDANGKMLLGMLFVFSKQYSDDLSTKVKRGINGNLNDGKSSGSPKWGYHRDLNGYYKPDNNFDLIQEAWTQRSLGMSNKEILKTLLEKNCYRNTKATRGNKKIRKIYPNEKTLSNIFKDPFYYGILIQAGKAIDLRDMYDFKAMINNDLFNKVQAISYARTRDLHPVKNREFKPLQRLVYCGVCNSDKWMVAGKNKPGGSNHYVLSYRCDNPACKRTTKSVRAKYIFEGIYSLLDKFELSDEAYERYAKQLDACTTSRITMIKKEIAQKQGALNQYRHELEEYSLNLGNICKDSPAYDINYQKIARLDQDCRELDSKIKKLKDKIRDPAKIKLTQEQFLNLIKTAAHKMRNGSVEEKDTLARILFLNLHIDDKKALSVIWKEPFASLIKAVEMSTGARERT